MKAYTPEISWHNRLPTLALDIAPPNPDIDNDKCYKVATGGNDCRVYIWTINPETLEIRIRAGLRRHQKSVGAVRFSVQHMLASGDDDGYIYLWKQKIEETQQSANGKPQDSEPSNAFLNDDGFEDIESWQHLRVLRGHIEDVCDLTWSSDGKFLLSGSVDNSAILWDTTKGTKIWCSDLIKGYVQGVAIDPHTEYMIALSSDRTLRTYNFSDRRLLFATRRMNIKNNLRAFFCDDTVQTFCRRLEFSPDGQFLVAPTSRVIERERPQKLSSKQQQHRNDQGQQQEEKCDGLNVEVNANTPATSSTTLPPPKPVNVLLVFKRGSFNKPHLYYQTGKEVALCVRFSPVAYALKQSENNFWKMPYRFLFAVATTRSLLIYDTQQPTPIGYVSQIHLARLTDLSWSHDGRMLMIASYDGYTTMIVFDKNDLGERYTEPLINPVQEREKEKERERELQEQLAEQIREQQRLEKERLQQQQEPPETKKIPEALTIRRFLIKRS